MQGIARQYRAVTVDLIDGQPHARNGPAAVKISAKRQHESNVEGAGEVGGDVWRAALLISGDIHKRIDFFVRSSVLRSSLCFGALR